MLFYFICFAAGCKRYDWKAPAIISTAGVMFAVALFFYMGVRTEAWPDVMPFIIFPAYVYGFLSWGVGRGCAALVERWRRKPISAAR